MCVGKTRCTPNQVHSPLVIYYLLFYLKCRRCLSRTQGVQTPVTPYTSATTPTSQKTTTFTAYAPNYAKENVSSSTQTQTGTGRGGRRQSNLKGLFTKERKLNFIQARNVFY